MPVSDAISELQDLLAHDDTLKAKLASASDAAHAVSILAHAARAIGIDMDETALLAAMASRMNDSVLSDKQLENVAGGAVPNIVNPQITDAIAQTNAKYPNAQPISFEDMLKLFNSH